MKGGPRSGPPFPFLRIPEEWTNVANDPNYVEVKNKLKVFVPKNAIPHVKGIYNKANEK